MIESTRKREDLSTVVLVHPHGRLASALESTAVEVASILDAVGIIARAGDRHSIAAVVVDRQQLDRFPDAASTIKRLDDQVRIIEIADESADGMDGTDVDARVGSAAPPTTLLAAVTGRSVVPSPDDAEATISTWPFEPVAATAPAPGPDLHSPMAPSEAVDEDERRALTEPSTGDAGSTDGPDAPDAPEASHASEARDASRPSRPSESVSPPSWPTWPGEDGPPETPAEPPSHPQATEPPVDGPAPLSFAEAVRARESQYDAEVAPQEPLGDVDLVEAVLAGEGRIGGVAVQLIREQTGWHDLVMEPETSDPQDTDPDVARATVGDDGHRFGELRSSIAGPDELELWAGWLSRWLELGRRHELYRSQSRTDELTGAANRREMFAFLDEVLTEARIRRRPVTVMVFDIDDFKRFNDEHGHAAGDTILRETVSLLKSVTRRSDRVCRVGGDEFAVIFADLEGPRSAGSSMLDDIEVIARRFQAQVQTMEFPRLGLDAPGRLSISAGLASFPWDGTDAETLLQVADHRALESKRRGKNHITFGPGVVFSAGESAETREAGTPGEAEDRGDG